MSQISCIDRVPIPIETWAYNIHASSKCPIDVQTIAHLLQKECQSQSHHRRGTPDHVLIPLDGDLLEALCRRIVNQVLDAVDGVEDKGPGQRHLDAALDDQWQTGKGGGHGQGLEVPAGQGRDQVADAVGVQAAREEHAREALEDGAAKEGLVLVVDLEVRAYGADTALGGQLGLGLVVGHGLGGGRAAEVEGRGQDGCLDGGILGEGGWLRD